MARRKKDDTRTFIASAIAIVCFIFAILVPFILAYFYTTSKSKLAEIDFDEFAGDETDFWLDNSEKSEFIQAYKNHQKNLQRIEYAHELAERNNVSINQDGQYSIRSKVGKQVREILAEYEPLSQDSEAILDSIAGLPRSRWQSINWTIKNYQICRSALIVWGVSFGLVFIYSLISSWGETDSLLSNAFMSATIMSAICSGIWYAIMYFFFTEGLESITPKPPIVTINNYDNF